MKFNWGIGITILYAGFILLVLGMVIFAMTKKTELVSDNYYDREIKYQEQIDKEKRTRELDGQIKTEYQGNYISVKFPAAYNLKDIRGTIHFYRPSDEGRDFKLNIEPDSTGEQKIITTKFIKGIWKMRLEWKMNGSEYYKEEIIRIE